MRDSTKSEKRARGRPRAYDADDALSNATDAFWLGGYSGTSLDTLSDATGMNRPSLYAAFGDKHALCLPAGGEPRGCFLIGTAVVESKVDEGVRTRLAQGLKLFDRAFEKRIRRAQTDGELSADADAAVLARVAWAILHSLALRSRAGDSRASLRATAAEGVALICGARNHTAPKAASMTGTRKRFEK
ncbi:TetR family transcriptional regulator C-terminal domain-containing protein [Paraburkholderia caribensis]|uniref:TetR family transcriptional regulator C-terminal domain-containing protein n=1 Tax=Paraburkholderia caribensis TaxID=75105 RepID=UPI00071ED3A5|nr:TetR family transcriptional regulator [Paraburkholderia caribensis]ALP65582.1 TetR family transcriptional regulator [Paraburkholderia caribensis]AUT55496.1 TetR/AcrR family transcriptional regulator [Paraburkholderia caribensis]